MKIEHNSDALAAYRYASLNQAGVAATYLQLTDEQKKAVDRADRAVTAGGLTEVGTAVADENTASSAITQAQSILQRMRTLTMQATGSSSDDASGSSGDAPGGDGEKIQAELAKLHDELDQITSTARVSATDAQQQAIADAQQQASSDTAQSRAAAEAKKEQTTVGASSGARPSDQQQPSDSSSGASSPDAHTATSPATPGSGPTAVDKGAGATDLTAAGDKSGTDRAGEDPHAGGSAVTASTGDVDPDGYDNVVPLVNGSHSARQALLDTRSQIGRHAAQALRSQTAGSTEHAAALLLE